MFQLQYDHSANVVKLQHLCIRGLWGWVLYTSTAHKTITLRTFKGMWLLKTVRINCLTTTADTSVLHICLISSLITISFCGKTLHYVVCTWHYQTKNTCIQPPKWECIDSICYRMADCCKWNTLDGKLHWPWRWYGCSLDSSFKVIY